VRLCSLGSVILVCAPPVGREGGADMMPKFIRRIRCGHVSPVALARAELQGTAAGLQHSFALSRSRRSFRALMKLEIPDGEFGGYIFDLDGTLIDTMPLHYRAWDAAMRHVGLTAPLDEELFYSLGGVPTRRVAELIAEHYKLSIDADAVFHHKESLFRELQADAKLIAPVADFARKIAQTHPVAIASGGPRVVVKRSLELAGLVPLFRVVVSADDVVHGKPAPDMFLLAAQQMGVAPHKCLVFEDAEPGMRAAEAAGMKWVRVPSRKPSRRPGVQPA
jgi:beta-phosphoglucomutase family hydrolase